MNNKNAKGELNVTDIPNEILKIFKDSYNNFKNEYGEKHIEQIKKKIENTSGKVKKTDLYYTGPIASAHPQMGIVYTKSNKLAAILKHEIWHLFNDASSGKNSLFYMPEHYKKILENNGYIKKIYEQTVKEKKEKFKDEPERLKCILVDYETFLKEYTVDDHEAEKWTEWFNCQTNKQDMEKNFWDWNNGFYTYNLSSKSYYDSFINIADMVSCLISKENLLEMYLQTDTYKTDYSYPQMIDEFDKKYMDALDEKEKEKYKYPYLKILMDTKTISDNAIKRPNLAKEALQSCMKTCINAYNIKLTKLKQVDISSAKKIYSEIKYIQEHMMWNIETSKMENLEYIDSMKKVEEQFKIMLGSLDIENPEVQHMLKNVDYSKNNKFIFKQNGEKIAKSLNIAKNTPKNDLENIGKYTIKTNKNGIKDNLYCSLEALIRNDKFNQLFNECEKSDKNILIEFSNKIEKANKEIDFKKIYIDIYKLYAQKLEKTLKVDENIDLLFKRYQEEIIELQENALFSSEDKKYLPELENVITIYEQKAKKYQENIDRVTEIKIGKEIQNRNIEPEKIRLWNENFANKYKDKLQNEINEINYKREDMSKNMEQNKKTNEKSIDEDLFKIASQVKISDFNGFSQNIKSVEKVNEASIEER